MKKILKFTLAICLLLCASLALVACDNGEVPLTEGNAVGNYRTIQVVFTPSDDNVDFSGSINLSRADYIAIKAKVDAGTQTTEEDMIYTYFAEYFDCTFEVKADGTIYERDSDDSSFLNGHWQIRDGKLEYTCDFDHTCDYEAQWLNGKIKITCTNRSGSLKGVTYYILEKVA